MSRLMDPLDGPTAGGPIVAAGGPGQNAAVGDADLGRRHSPHLPGVPSRQVWRPTARLHCTNIVPVFGVGWAVNAHSHVMRYIDGPDLVCLLEDIRRWSTTTQ